MGQCDRSRDQVFAASYPFHRWIFQAGDRKESETMRFCCVGFEEHVRYAGERGFAVFSTLYEDGDVAYIVQHRVMNPDANAPVTSSPLSLIGEMHIRFCPWCGQNLKRIYGTDSSIMRSDLKLR